VIPLDLGDTHCPNGGEEIDVGVDSDGDGVLDVSEVQQKAFVCNGGGGCGMGLEACGASCVVLASDGNNCGSCGNVCADGSVCTAGACTPVVCPAGQSVCSDACVDLGADNQNCGACGNVCTTGTTCGGGACVDVNFGNVPINTSVTKQVTITVDAGYLILSAFINEALQPPFAFDFGTCASPAGTGPGTCVVNETFAPTVAQTFTATLLVNECRVTNSSDCITIPATIYANAVDANSGGPATVDFGTVPINTTVAKTIPLRVDAGYLILSAFINEALQPPFAFDFGTCASAAGTGPGICNVNETLAPTTAGPLAVQLQVNECRINNSSDCITILTNLTANVVDATSRQTPFDFGTIPIGTSVTRSIPIVVDSGYLILAAFINEALQPPFTFDFGTCATSAGTGPGTCSVTETFAPTDPVSESVTLIMQECLVNNNSSCINFNVPITAIGASEADATGN
jgi:hypothetical protein